MSANVPSAKLIDIDSSFEEIHDDSIDEISNSSPSRDGNENSPNDEDDSTKLDVTFSTAQYESRWSRSASVGGTILNDPAFKSDFNGDYRLWSKVSEQKKKLASTSLTSSFLNILGGSGSKSSDTKASKYSLDHLLTSSSEHNLNSSLEEEPSSARKPLTGSISTENGIKMASQYRPTEWSMNSLQSSQTGKNHHSSYGETQRLVDGSSSRLIANDDEDYDSDGFGYNGQVNGGGTSGSKAGCTWGLYKGIFYSSMSSVFFSLSAVIVKYLKDIHPGQLAVCRFVGIFVLTIPLIVYHDLNPFGPKELRHLLILRGLAGATSLFLRFIAFQNLPIADASVIIFSIPVFVSIFAWIFLKEPCGLFQSFTIVIAMIGLMMTTKLPFLFGGDSSLLYPGNTYYLYNSMPSVSSSSANLASISASLSSVSNVTSVVNTTAAHHAFHQLIQPPAQEQKLSHFYGVLAALSSLVFASAVFIFIRKAKGAHHAVIMFNFGWVAVIETTVVTTVLQGFSLPANPFEWYLIVILGVFSFCGQILLTRSLQLEQAGPVSVVRATTDIALAFLWQIIIFKETPDLWSIFGALLVSSCILLTSLRKWVLSLPEHSRLRAKFYFLAL